MAGNNGFHVEDIASILDGKQAIIDAQPPARRTPAAKIAHAIGQSAIAATHAELMRRTQRPTINLVAGLVSDRVDAVEIEQDTVRLTSYVGLQVRWNIFDGKRSQGERLAALARMRAREARLDAAIAQVRDEGNRLVSELAFYQTQMDARARRAELLARRIELAENPQAEDRVSAKEQLELRLEYLRAEQRVATAKSSYLMTMAQLASLVFKDPIAGA